MLSSAGEWFWNGIWVCVVLGWWHFNRQDFLSNVLFRMGVVITGLIGIAYAIGCLGPQI